MTTQITQLDRYRGCLLGGAVGDALGAAVEFDDIDTIRHRFGPAGITDPAEAYGRVGAITDDTQMTLFTAEGVLQADDRLERGVGNPPANLWFAYQRWLRTQGVRNHADVLAGQLSHGELHRIEILHSRRAPGTTCLSALSAPVDLNPPDGDDPIADNDSKGCGGVMRAAPCGLVEWENDLTFRLGAASAALTHGHSSGYLAAGALATMIRVLRGDRSTDDAVSTAVEELRRRDGSDEVRRALIAARDLAADGQPADLEQLGRGWVAEEALAIAVFCALMHPDDFAAAVRLAANHSGDSDSTAAITGNIMGTMLGVDAIPARWLAVLELRETIDRLATAMHDRFILGRFAVGWDLWGYPDEDEGESGPGTPPPHDSYWALPGRLLAGPYPGAKSRDEAARKLDDFLALGVTCFVDLTEEGEGALKPYGALLRARAKKSGVAATHLRMPIRDVDVAPTWRMRAIQDAICRALDAGEIVYVHCWGGVGRTGTVVGCHLVQCEAHSGDEALAALKHLRAATQRAGRTSPETSAQREMVRGWHVSDAPTTTLPVDQGTR